MTVFQIWKTFGALSDFFKIFSVIQVQTGKNPTTPLYSETKRSGNFLNEKNVKITKWAHTFKDFASSYNIEILNSLKPALQLKNTEFVIKNKLEKSSTELRGFKFMTTLVLVFKKIKWW